MSSNRRNLRVLGITADTMAVRQLRMDMPLFSLRRQELIQDYFVTNPDLRDLPEDFSFDVIWLQRVNDVRLIDMVDAVTHGSFMYDIDDLLIGKPSYLPYALEGKHGVVKALEGCKALCVSSMRLCGLLEKHASVKLRHKAVECPNSFDFPREIRRPEPPSGILWTSSDYVALNETKEVVLDAVDQFSNKYDLPIYFFGRLTEDLKQRFSRLIGFGFVPYWQHKVVLGSLAPMIGVAPLETRGDEDTLDFIAGKSDLKMVEFGGFGHPSVYSNSPPYSESDLKAGVIVENTKEAWLEGLQRALKESWKSLDTEQERVVNLRHVDTVASKAWYEAISRVRLRRPLRVKDIRPLQLNSPRLANVAPFLASTRFAHLIRRMAKRLPEFVLRRL